MTAPPTRLARTEGFMPDSPTKRRLKRAGLISVGLLTVAVVVLSFVQLWVIYGAGDMQAYGAVLPDASGLPGPDQRGAFLVLNDVHSGQFPSNIVQLLATTDPGVVSPEEGAHLVPSELKGVLVQSAIVGEPSDYRVYEIGTQDQAAMKATKQPGGRAMLVVPANGRWEPGAYIVDVPAEGMFGGRTYYQFYIDEPK